VYFPLVIISFADSVTETLFLGRELSRKDRNKLGGLNPIKAFERLAILHQADEKALLLIPFIHYHKLKGTPKYSIDADSRKSPWRITFEWENSEMKNVTLVKIEDTH
jgi:plasmid maintenance system killer protein